MQQDDEILIRNSLVDGGERGISSFDLRQAFEVEPRVFGERVECIQGRNNWPRN